MPNEGTANSRNRNLAHEFYGEANFNGGGDTSSPAFPFTGSHSQVQFPTNVYLHVLPEKNAAQEQDDKICFEACMHFTGADFIEKNQF